MKEWTPIDNVRGKIQDQAANPLNQQRLISNGKQMLLEALIVVRYLSQLPLATRVKYLSKLTPTVQLIQKITEEAAMTRLIMARYPSTPPLAIMVRHLSQLTLAVQLIQIRRGSR